MTIRKTITENDMKQLVKAIETKYAKLEKENPDSFKVRDVTYKIYANGRQARIELTADHFSSSVLGFELMQLNHLELHHMSAHNYEKHVSIYMVITLK